MVYLRVEGHIAEGQKKRVCCIQPSPETEKKKAACSLDACTFAVTHPVKKVAQWRLRGIDVHAEQLLKSQERFGLDISPRSRIRKCSSFIQ